jgi:sulfatase modifying factor 1
MKAIGTLAIALIATITSVISTRSAAQLPSPPVPASLEPLKAKLANSWYAHKGPTIIFRADRPLADEQWKAVQRLRLKIVDTGGKGIDDEAIARFAKMDLEVINLDGAELTDAGCKHLADMKSLRVLGVVHNSFGKKEFAGSGLAHLKDAAALESLTLAGCSTGEDAMAAVGELTQLKEFKTWHTKQTDPRHLHLLKLKNLKSLLLGNNLRLHDDRPRRLSLTDATLETIAGLKSLERLELWEARLSLSALLRLKALPNLKALAFTNVDIPADDLERLRREMPGVTIDFKPPTDQERAKLIGELFTFTNGSGMKFAWVPPGSFLMGSPTEEKERKRDEARHKVTLTKGFYLGVHPVTQEQWTKLMGKNPSKFRDGKNLPVEQVNWNECREFIEKLREQDKGRPYRLPTEAEWEYACRAGTTTPFSFGETISTDLANYNGNYSYGDGKKGVYREKTVPVVSFRANAWGLHDMHGNVSQWCQDFYAEEYPKGDAIDPLGETGENRVIRGGSWIDNPLECRSAYRGGCKPVLRHSLIGFRICFTDD